MECGCSSIGGGCSGKGAGAEPAAESGKVSYQFRPTCYTVGASSFGFAGDIILHTCRIQCDHCVYVNIIRIKSE